MAAQYNMSSQQQHDEQQVGIKPEYANRGVPPFVQFRDGHHAVAISLNNTAVWLLQHGQYGPATATLHDALSILKLDSLPKPKQQLTSEDSSSSSISGSNNGNSTTTTINSNNNNEIQRLIQRACRRVSSVVSSNNKNNNKGPSTVTAATSNSVAVLNVVAISSQSNPSIVQSALISTLQDDHHSLATTATRKQIFPISIDPIDFESRNRKDVSLETCMILYNLGICFYCLGTVEFESRTITRAGTTAVEFQTRIQTKVYNIFKTVETRLSRMLYTSNNSMSMSMPCILHSMPLFLLKTVLTYHLHHVTFTMMLVHGGGGMTNVEYQQYHNSILPYLLRVIVHQDPTIRMGGRHIAGAA